MKSILFDLDGVLVDACDWHYLALNKALYRVAKEEITRDEHISTFNGLPTKQKLQLLHKQNRIKEEHFQDIWNLKQELTKETILETATIDLSKIELHEFLKSNNVKIACCTNSILETTKIMLESTGQFNYMDYIVSNEMVRNNKPHPECYIKGMVYFSSMPEDTFVVEDSPVGLQAATNSGAVIWKVSNPTEVTLRNLLSHDKYSLPTTPKT